ncbi:unnamed protein product [Linum trigynum]|uniref:Uncharacterized protein n=1 Tax=Linum trigynum TaxID=586398 RepID=A0AAV2FUG2_9ROSI
MADKMVCCRRAGELNEVMVQQRGVVGARAPAASEGVADVAVDRRRVARAGRGGQRRWLLDLGGRRGSARESCRLSLTLINGSPKKS